MTISHYLHPPLNELIDGEWFNIAQEDGSVWHTLIVQCPKCGLGIRYTPTHNEIKNIGLEGAEEIAENIVRQMWNKETDCPHITFRDKE